MKVVIVHDDDGKEEFTDATDVCVIIRQLKPMANSEEIRFLPNTWSRSWGHNIRELLKEMRQATIELEEILRAHTAKI